MFWLQKCWSGLCNVHCMQSLHFMYMYVCLYMYVCIQFVTMGFLWWFRYNYRTHSLCTHVTIICLYVEYFGNDILPENNVHTCIYMYMYMYTTCMYVLITGSVFQIAYASIISSSCLDYSWFWFIRGDLHLSSTCSVTSSQAAWHVE